MTFKEYREQAERLWHNCIHKNIGSFTLTQERNAITEIAMFLVGYRQDMKDDIRLVVGCLKFRGNLESCDNKDCTNDCCPLNKEFLK